jgi:hypothetical protein
MPKGRPRKEGKREPNGRLQRGRVVLPPAFDTPGLAISADDYVERDVTERGQIVARTVQRRSVLDTLPAGWLDGDQVMALRTYEARRDAVAYPAGRCTLDRTPTGGGGIEAFHDALRDAAAAYGALRACLPPALSGLLDDVLAKRREWTLRDRDGLRAAADCLVVVLDRRRAA